MSTSARTLIDVLEAVAHRQATGFSYVTDGGVSRFESYGALFQTASRIGQALQTRGLRKGDRLGLLIVDCQQFIDSFWGALLVGVIPVPIAPPPARFGQSEAFLRRLLPIVAKAKPRLLLTDENLSALLACSATEVPIGPLVTLDSLLREIDTAARHTSVDIRPQDTAFLQFTSGSTAHPKGVWLNHTNLVANVQAIAGRHGLQSTPADYCVSWLPLYHDMGLIGKVLVPLIAGMRGALFMSPALFLKRPLSWLHQISRRQGTITFAPNFAYNLCVTRSSAKAQETLDLSSLRVAGCAAEPIRYEVLTAFARTFASVGFRPEAFLPCYGLAEHTLAATFTPVHRGITVDRVYAEALARGQAVPAHDSTVSDEASGTATRHQHVVHIVSCGRVFPGHACRIVDAAGHPMPERMVGEILLRGPSVMQGYFEDADATAATIHDAWLHTGDLGYLVDGQLYVCGRLKDLIIIHGRNYHPQDLEWEAGQVSGIRKGSVVAFGLADAEGIRERVVIVAETRLPQARHDQLQHTVRTRILESLALTVDQVLLVPPRTLPKTTSGKLQRLHTRDLFQAGTLGASSVPTEAITTLEPPAPV